MADLRGALDLLVREPGVGSKVETSRPEVVRRLYLGRIHYFVYYRVRGNTLEVVAFWHERRGHTPNV
jgi:plasmid stabilization system protein ParE